VNNRIIIENRSSLSDLDILKYIEDVISEGRISNDGKQYCYLTCFKEVVVSTYLNKGSDRFIVTDVADSQK